MTSFFRQWIGKKAGRNQKSNHRSPKARLMLKGLESRVVPATFFVTNTNDTGAGSLRQAMLDANAAAGDDNVVFDATVFASPQTITLASALPASSNMVITGTGANLVTINGNNAVRGFTMASSTTLTLENLTLTNCRNSDVAGGVYVASNGNLTIRNSTLSGNTGTVGGGVYFFNNGSLLVENSTISGNTASGSTGGGGIYFYGTVSAGGFTIRNSTFSGNSAASGVGGGLQCLSFTGTALIQNSTFTQNTASSGGGISVPSSASSVLTIESTIVSGNTGSGANKDIAAGTINANFSAIGVNSGFTLSGSSANNLAYGASLGLLNLGNYGGRTQTHAISAGSPLLNAGSNPASLTTDQRGTGYPRVVNGGVDIGAFEGAVDQPTAVIGALPNVTTTGVTSYTFTVTYTGATPVNVSTLDSNDIRVTGPNSFNQLATFVSASPNTNGSPIVATYTFNAPGGSFGISSNGTYTIALQANQVANTSGSFAAPGTLGSFQVAIPQVFIVTNLNDSGTGSLRQAILDANTAATADVINFQSGLAGTITLTTGQLNITDSVTINGPGSTVVTVNGNNNSRIFNVDNSSSIINVAISGLTVTGGNGTDGAGSAADGGGINVTNEILTLTDVIVTGNTAGANDGGGIDATSTAFITLRNSTVSGNTTSRNGGGVYFFSGGSLLMENSTISGNSSTGSSGGGGIYFFGTVSAGGFTIRNSTISGNSATSGGGIVLRSFTGTALIQNSTITQNTGTSTDATLGVGGGGISIPSGTPVLTLESTIVSNNSAANGYSDISTISAGTVNVNYSAIGSNAGFTPSGSSANNLAFGTSLGLLPLGFYGGPTQTQPLSASSAAVNAGSNPASLTTDQRGPGFPRQVGGAVDIGAVEGGADYPLAAATLPNVTTAGVTSYTFTVAYSSVSNLIASSLNSNDIRITGPNGFNQLATFVSATPSTNSPNIAATYSIAAPGGVFDDTNMGTYTVSLLANEVANAAGNFAAAQTLGTFLVAVPGPYIVRNLNDAGAGSLRAAIANSNSTPGITDTIQFLAGLTGTITLTSGQLNITDSCIITGPGVSSITVSGGSTSRIFNINGTGTLNVAISGMTITGGNGSTGSGGVASDGGAIKIDDETVVLTNVVVSGNNAGSNDGGAISMDAAGFLTVRNSTISGNTAGGAGGGIYMSSGSILIDGSTISSNTANGTSGGGGVRFSGTVGASGFMIINSTFSGNNVPNGSGGGLYLASLTGLANVQNSTFTLNNSGTTSTTAGLGGGGIAAATGAGNLALQSTIISGNTANATNGRSDLAANTSLTVDAGNCAILDPDGYTLAANFNNLAANTVLNLLPLASNGGPTQTHALSVGSPAVDAGSNPSGLTTDQRGTGFPRQVGGTVDIGAFEGTVDQPVAAAGSLPNVTTSGVTSYTITVTYSGATAINVSTLDGNDIRVTGPGGFNQLASFVSASPNTNGSPITATYSLAAPGGAFTQSANGTYSVALQGSQVANVSGIFAAAATLGTFQVLIPQTFIVTNLNDSGAGSLRQAILDSNASPTTDAINFQSGLTGTITLTSGQLTISDNVTITGPGSSLLTVNGNNVTRIFNINGTGTLNVAISGMTVTGGNGTNGSGAAADGGAISVADEVLTLTNMVISGNTSGTNDGGGLTATSTAFVTLQNSTVSGNTANNGGGLYFFNGGSLLVLNSTISGNTSSGSVGGGAIYFFGAVTAQGFTIRNSTISGNSASGGSGGGIVLPSFNGTALIQNSTITNNSAGTTSTTAGTGGGGIASTSTTTTLTIVSSIVSGNTSGNVNKDISIAASTTANANFSAIGDSNGFTLSGTSANNLAFGATLNLGALANNGGPTRTHALGSGSAAIDTGSNPVSLAFDQRGTGYARSQGAATDIGAFETSPVPLPKVNTVTMNGGATQRSRVTSVTITFNTIVNFAGPVANAFQLVRTGSGGGAVGGFTATAQTVNNATVVTLTGFTGAQTNFGSLANGFYNLTVLANQVSNSTGQLDGNNSGSGGTNYVLTGSAVNKFYRYFGDVTGDATVDADDLAIFVSTLFNSQNYIAAMDYDNNGSVDADDLAVFIQDLFVPL